MAYDHVPLTYQGHPLPNGAPAGAPVCWGSAYNSEDRTCRNCPFAGTCRNEVLRKDLAARPVGVQPTPPPSPYYAAPQPVYVAPRPVNMPPPQYSAPQPVPIRYGTPGPAPVQMQQQPPQRATPIQPAPLQYGYGSFYDPMYYALGQVPEPFRPQVQGESFLERVMKNMMLAGVGAIFKEGLLAVRQLQWWPQPKEITAGERTVDVTPARS